MFGVEWGSASDWVTGLLGSAIAAGVAVGLFRRQRAVDLADRRAEAAARVRTEKRRDLVNARRIASRARMALWAEGSIGVDMAGDLADVLFHEIDWPLPTNDEESSEDAASLIGGFLLPREKDERREQAMDLLSTIDRQIWREWRATFDDGEIAPAESG